MKTIKVTLHIWRQKQGTKTGDFETFPNREVSVDSSFLEFLDQLNDELITKNKEPIAFDHDCREGICGTCGMVVNGMPHGPRTLTTTCQLHMREFKTGVELWVEPWRAEAFPVVRDLVVDRSAFDRVIGAGGYIAVNTGSAQDANEIPIPKTDADLAMDAAACIGCGACVAACPNASAMLFTSAKLTHLGTMPQGKVEQGDRVRKMVAQMEAEGFGGAPIMGSARRRAPRASAWTLLHA